MNNNHVYDMLVVGGGPGGYTAALYAARAGLDTVVLEKLSAGGQMALTEQIDNYPGFENGIDGFSLAENMQKQAERFGARSEYAEVLRMDLTAVPKLLETSEGIFRGKTVVLATGADPRTLGVAGETELLGRGVAYCAACDGMFYKYNRPGGSVRVSVTQELEKLLLRVSDTGCGIPEEYQRSIFQPFFRVDKSRSREYGGAGLGLSLVWEIADLHGGSVWVEKSSEKGTTIAVELPTQQSTKP